MNDSSDKTLTITTILSKNLLYSGKSRKNNIPNFYVSLSFILFFILFYCFYFCCMIFIDISKTSTYSEFLFNIFIYAFRYRSDLVPVALLLFLRKLCVAWITGPLERFSSHFIHFSCLNPYFLHKNTHVGIPDFEQSLFIY